MIVVADTGPVNYLILIDAVEVLAPLFGKVLVPEAVLVELLDLDAPPKVRDWSANPPTWFEITENPIESPGLDRLDPGERAAMSLAVERKADLLLLDERAGRAEAARRSIPVIGTLGVLVEAHTIGLLDFDEAVTRLKFTSCRISAELETAARSRLSR